MCDRAERGTNSASGKAEQFHHLAKPEQSGDAKLQDPTGVASCDVRLSANGAAFLLSRMPPSSDGEAALTGGPVSDGGREEPFLRRNALTEGEAFLPRPPPQAACAPVLPAGGGVRRGALSVWKKTYRGSCKKSFALPKAADGISPRRGTAAKGCGRPAFTRRRRTHRCFPPIQAGRKGRLRPVILRAKPEGSPADRSRPEREWDSSLRPE